MNLIILQSATVKYFVLLMMNNIWKKINFSFHLKPQRSLSFSTNEWSVRQSVRSKSWGSSLDDSQMLPLFNGRRLHNSAALLSSHAQCPITYDDPLCYACVSQTTETRGRQSRLDVAKVKQIGRKRNINPSAQCCCWLNRPHLGCGNQAHLAQEQLKLPKERERGRRSTTVDFLWQAKNIVWV